ncbi:MAG: FMN-binding protein [Lentisphaerae bacterium]|jgi:Na+-transporting NADH:ubiquinone oxidoreductase subunit C|nr:FMN-binding protein [Lentisphaerota bacterium]MBT4820512.1 FMN-binding protein [Lentisphaerota bacterium]MBT5608106.1 FMN-binding protein [Lentisphaerota bacterium]MBT7060617.1 FMN-binding protein [Lentisphaerota bacterium]MBT7847716.1 FMN-binding protein [Lentisphaerota bacterium]
MKSQAYVILFMVVMAAIFGAGVTGINLVSESTLEANAAYLRDRALVEVLNLGDLDSLSKADVAALVAERVDQEEVCKDPETGWTFKLIKAYEDAEKTRLAAYAFRFRGPGFWAPIEGILAVEPGLERTCGLTILEQSETPGLGGRVAEPVFLDQFVEENGILIAPSDTGRTVVLNSERAGDRCLDGITGATQTSMAMERILNQYLACFHRAVSNRGTGTNGHTERIPEE